MFYFTLSVFHSVAALHKLFHNKTYCICLFLDLRKELDTVNVENLVEKLIMYDIHGAASLFRNSYLSNRDQYVVCVQFNIFINNILQLGMKNVRCFLCRISKFS